MEIFWEEPPELFLKESLDEFMKVHILGHYLGSPGVAFKLTRGKYCNRMPETFCKGMHEASWDRISGMFSERIIGPLKGKFVDQSLE